MVGHRRAEATPFFERLWPGHDEERPKSGYQKFPKPMSDMDPGLRPAVDLKREHFSSLGEPDPCPRSRPACGSMVKPRKPRNSTFRCCRIRGSTRSRKTRSTVPPAGPAP